ncbi:histidine phosphatase family protein [Lysinibacillus fusiformis]|uniref:histidine phosphatase family protein n=1 Tax=Lysinibacillus fusiformis TaxID=28031 RepID=UPI0028113BAA|nr:histidine phosphatase family protein [Lysinibacillus fusiformis]
MQKTTLYIVRHGQTEWNIQKKMQGHRDSALTELGESQAQWLYEFLLNLKFCLHAAKNY